MEKETEDVQRTGQSKRPLDAFDRKILAALTNDGRATYADVGEKVGLSAPAVHERVKRLRRPPTLHDSARFRYFCPRCDGYVRLCSEAPSELIEADPEP